MATLSINYATPAGLELPWCPGSRGALAASLGCFVSSALLLGVLETTPVQLPRPAVISALLVVVVAIPTACAAAGGVVLGRIIWDGRAQRGLLPASAAFALGALHALLGLGVVTIAWNGGW